MSGHASEHDQDERTRVRARTHAHTHTSIHLKPRTLAHAAAESYSHPDARSPARATHRRYRALAPPAGSPKKAGASSTATALRGEEAPAGRDLCVCMIRR